MALFQSEGQECPFYLIQLANLQAQLTYYTLFLKEINPILLHSPLTLHTLLTPVASLNLLTATLSGVGQWHYPGSVIVSKFLLTRAEIHQKEDMLQPTVQKENAQTESYSNL